MTTGVWGCGGRGLSRAFLIHIPVLMLGFGCSQRSISFLPSRAHHSSLLLPPPQPSDSFAGSCPSLSSKSWGAAGAAFFPSLLVLRPLVIAAPWFPVPLPLLSPGRASPARPAAHLILTTGVSTSTCPKGDSSSYALKSIFPSLSPLSVPASPVSLTPRSVLGIVPDTSPVPSSPLPLRFVRRSCTRSTHSRITSAHLHQYRSGAKALWSLPSTVPPSSFCPGRSVSCSRHGPIGATICTVSSSLSLPVENPQAKFKVLNITLPPRVPGDLKEGLHRYPNGRKETDFC